MEATKLSAQDWELFIIRSTREDRTVALAIREHDELEGEERSDPSGMRDLVNEYN